MRKRGLALESQTVEGGFGRPELAQPPNSAIGQNLESAVDNAHRPTATAECAADPVFRVWKIGVSALLLYHLCGLMVTPATIEPSPQFFRDIYPAFGPYLQFLNMNQGSHFFAPEPGASTLIGYVVETNGGGQITGRLPHRGIWPRLLYHRHFMLTESLAQADDADPRIGQLLTRALARELMREHGGRSVMLTRLTHFLAGMEDVRAGKPLDSAEFFEEAPIGRFEWADLIESFPR